MRYGSKGRYAVMALVHLAQRSGDKPVALSEIAEHQNISLSYLEQIFARLRRGSIVASVRGPGGGYRLARPAAELPVADIMEAVEEAPARAECNPSSISGCRMLEKKCDTHALWEALSYQMHAYLSSVTLDDVLAGRIEVGDDAHAAGGVAALAAE